MQLTIDSSEPLAKILTVVGALYGVELSTAAAPGAPVEAPAPAPRKRAAKRAPAAPAAAEAPTPVTEPAAAEPAAKKSRPAKKAKVAATEPVADAEGSADGPLSQRVRAWARDNNLAVNSRGRLSTSVLAAYTAAHS